jgi:sortase (surface protein transpeptidase)
MKKLLITLIFTFGSICYSNAQVDKDENPTEEAQEKMQQEPRGQSTQIRVENAANQSATQDKQNKEQAEKDRKKAEAEKIQRDAKKKPAASSTTKNGTTR